VVNASPTVPVLIRRPPRVQRKSVLPREHRVYGSEYKRTYDHGHEAYKASDYHYEPFY